MSQDVSVFWFRRDLRLDDNHGLYRALKSGCPVLALFIFDNEILSQLPKKDARVEFILEHVRQLNEQLQKAGSALHVYSGSPYAVWREILREHRVRSIYCNEDYEPYAIQRDEAIAELAAVNGTNFYAVKDQVLFAKNDVVKEDGQPYKVFTPYARRWKLKLKENGLEAYPSQKNLMHLLKGASATKIPTLSELGFEPSGIELPAGRVSKEKIKKYAKTRDFMGEKGTTRLGVQLRFGTVSVRKLVRFAQPLSEVFLNELIWREFFQQVLYHFPHTATKPFDARYRYVKWINDKKQFAAWCEGKTGYPVVDAAMHELNRTGFMHNRARMIVASFLTKHLLIDWRWGERYFAEKLLDYELAANVGNWQWAAGCGCDAAPYFRVFNPTLQAKKFDPKGKYVADWDGFSEGLKPIVDHVFARKRAIAAFKKVLSWQNLRHRRHGDN